MLRIFASVMRNSRSIEVQMDSCPIDWLNIVWSVHLVFLKRRLLRFDWPELLHASFKSLPHWVLAVQAPIPLKKENH